MQEAPVMSIQTRFHRNPTGTPSPDAGRATTARGRHDANARMPRLAMGPSRPHWYLPCKAVFDVAAAAVLLVLATPVILLAALLVKLTSRGPAFYTQTRVGRDGRLFTIYKVRTMIHRCESLTGPRWSMPGDPRITFLGHFLRRTHLDELPQLVNVLLGDMSLIGPRPERPEFLPELEAALPCYGERLVMKPGVTGLAQVQLPADTDLDSVREKLAYDLYYIGHVGPWLDLRLLLTTALYAFGVPFAFSRWLFAIPSGEVVERVVSIPAATGPVPRQRKSA
jgi:lipopolysaccharide/colanic/teichoic acid biosynthesis glycosyltransferase